MPLPLLRSPYDRDIVRLAVPALGALAAEPLYLLADTAMVGHLGTDELAALAIAATLLAGTFTLFNFLTYGTTAQVARFQGAGEELEAGRLAAQALWLSAGIGVVLTALLAGFAVPLVSLMGGDDRVGDLAVLYLRIGSLGLPSALIALAGQGYLRGVSDLRTPLVIVVVANAVNVRAERGVHLRVRLGARRLRLGNGGGTERHGCGVRASAAVGAGRLTAPVARPDAPAGADRRRDLRPHGRSVRLLPGGERSACPDGQGLAGGAPDRIPAVRVPGAGARRDRDRGAGDRWADARRGRRRGRVQRGAAHDRVGGGGGRRLRRW